MLMSIALKREIAWNIPTSAEQPITQWFISKKKAKFSRKKKNTKYSDSLKIKAH